MAYQWRNELTELLKKMKQNTVEDMALPLNLIQHLVGPKDKRDSISADELREYLTTIYGIQGLVISVIKILNLDIVGDLSLNGTTTKAGLEFFNCRFLRPLKKEEMLGENHPLLDGGPTWPIDEHTPREFDGHIWLSDAVLRSLMLTDCSLGAIIAPRLQLSGSFKMEDASTKEKRSRIFAINLDGAKIGGNLNLSGIELEGIDYGLQEERQAADRSDREVDFYSLRGDGIEVGGNIVLDDGFTAHKGIRLNGCTVGRTISFSGSVIDADSEKNKKAEEQSSGNGREDQTGNRDRENRYSLSMTVAHIKGNLNFGRKRKVAQAQTDESVAVDAQVRPNQPVAYETAYETQFIGTIRLSKTTVEGGLNFRNLNCLPSRRDIIKPIEIDDPEGVRYDPHEEEDYAVDARGMTVKASTQFINIEAHGPLNFRRATLMGGIFGDGMDLFYPSAQVFVGDDTTITGAVSLQSVKTTGILQFNQAHLLGGFTISKFILQKCTLPNDGIRGKLKHWRTGKTCGLVIERATIKGQFDIIGLTCMNKELNVTSRLCLDGTEIPAVRQGAVDVLKAFEEVHLLDCTYSSVTWHEDSPEPVPAKPGQDLRAWVVCVLDRTYAKETYRIAENISVGEIPKWDRIKYKLASQKSGVPALIFALLLVMPIWLLPVQLLLPVLFFLSVAILTGMIFTAHSVVRFLVNIKGRRKGLLRLATPRKKKPWGVAQSNQESARIKTSDADKAFHPQPYIQLARALRAAGFDREANSVIIDMEWRRTWHGHLTTGEKFWQYLKGLLLSFGLDKVRPVLTLVLLTLLSSLPFTYAFEQGKIIPSRANQYCPTSPSDRASASSKLESYKTIDFGHSLLNDPKSSSGLIKELNADEDWNKDDFCLVDNKKSDALAYVQFNGLLFSLDAILPLTDLGQRKNWIFEPVAHPEDALRGKNPTADWGSFWIHNVHRLGYDISAWGHDYLQGLFFNRYVVLFYADAVFGSLVTSMFLAGLVGLIANRY